VILGESGVIAQMVDRTDDAQALAMLPSTCAADMHVEISA